MGPSITNQRRRLRGVAVIELALTLVFLLLITIGITEVGRVFWYYDALQKAVRDGARCISMLSDLAVVSNVTACRQRVIFAAHSAGVSPDLNLGNVVYSNSGGSPPEYVTVRVTNYAMSWIWSLGAPLPDVGETTPLAVRATMPYMKP